MPWRFLRKSNQRDLPYLISLNLDLSEITHTDLPDADEARRDGRIGLPVNNAISRIKRFFADTLDAANHTMRKFISATTTELVQVRVREANALDKVDRIGEPVDNILLAILFLIMVLFCADGEGRMLQGLAAVFASGFTARAYETGLLIALVGAGLLKIAIANSRIVKSVAAHWASRVAVAVIGLLLVLATAVIRPRFMEIVEASMTNNHQLSKLLAENSGAILLMFVAYSLGLWLMSALALERAMQVLDAHIAAWRYGRIRSHRERLERDLAVAEISLAGAQDSFDRAMELKIADYEYEYELGKLGDTTPSDGERFASILNFAAGVIGALFAGAISAVIAYSLSHSPELAIATGGMVTLLAGGGAFWLMRNGAALASIVLIGLSFLNGGCGRGPQQPKAVAVVLDTSESVRVEEGALEAAAETVMRRAGRCTNLTILPVNEEAFDYISVHLPCEAVIFDGDLKQASKELTGKLAMKLPAWRRKGSRSDYRGALRQAAEAVKRATNRTILIIGDMVDDRDRGPSPSRPSIPGLPSQGLSGTTVYLGWVRSSALDKLSDSERDLFASRWKEAFESAGAKPEGSPFGLQGLDGFAAAHFQRGTNPEEVR